MKFNEVQKYITNVKYLFSLEPLIVSEAVFKKQPKEVQQAILDSGKEASDHVYKWLLETEDKIKEDLKKKGMEINDPDNQEKDFILKAKEEVWPQFYKSIGGKENLDRVLAELGR